MRTLRRDHQSNVRSAMRHQAKSVYEVLAAELGPIIGTKQWKATLKTIKEKLGDQSH
jgi:hypothetical protein